MAITPPAIPSARPAISSPRPRSARCSASWSACRWRRAGWIRAPPPACVLAELGPGRGTLMADALRATRRVPGFHAALEVHLVETSPSLRAAQAQRVPQAIWHDTVADLPERPLCLVANEFFDALPIRQFVRDGDGWRERLVALADDRLGFALSDRAVLPDLGHRLGDVTAGRHGRDLPGAGAHRHRHRPPHRPPGRRGADRSTTATGARWATRCRRWKSTAPSIRLTAPARPI